MLLSFQIEAVLTAQVTAGVLNKHTVQKRKKKVTLFKTDVSRQRQMLATLGILILSELNVQFSQVQSFYPPARSTSFQTISPRLCVRPLAIAQSMFF